MAVDNINLFAANHAIEVVHFVVVFRSQLDSSDEARFEENIDQLKELFAAIDKPEFVQFSVGNGPLAQETKPVMFQLNEFSREGKPEWSARFGDNAIAVSCQKYTGWEDTWADAKARLIQLLVCVDQFKAVASVEYIVTDTFTEDMSIPLANRQLLSSNIFQSGSWAPGLINDYADPRWDFQAAMFVEDDEKSEVLERVEARSVISGKNIVASLTNSLAMKFRNVQRVKELLSDAGQSNELNDIFDKFHEMNKVTVKCILSDELTKKMGLE